MSLIGNGGSFPPKKDPIERPDHTAFIVNSLRAVAEGTADERQQKESIEYIIKVVCGTYDMPYRPGGNDRDTVFALGKQHVGQTLVWLVNDAPTKGSPDKKAALKAN